MKTNSRNNFFSDVIEKKPSQFWNQHAKIYKERLNLFGKQKSC